MNPSNYCQGTGKSSRIWKTGKLVTFTSYDLLESGLANAAELYTRFTLGDLTGLHRLGVGD